MDVESYIEQKATNLVFNTSIRVICCFCNKQTLSIKRTVTGIVYHCFSASCKRSGKYNLIATTDEIMEHKKKMSAGKPKFSLRNYPNIYLGLCRESQHAYILKHNGIDAYRNGNYSIGYDVNEHRIVYFLGLPAAVNYNEARGAVGRSLKGDFPKVKLYENSEIMPFICGKKDSDACVLVEDCASAASVNCDNTITGIALLGTILKPEYIPHLVNYKTIYIALDPDAKEIAIAIRNILTYICKDVRIWNIPCDFKDMTTEEVIEFIKRNT